MNDQIAQSYAKLTEKKRRYDQVKKKINEERDKMPKVIIKGIDISFWDMMMLMIQIFVAAIPAAIIAGLIYAWLIKTLASL